MLLAAYTGFMHATWQLLTLSTPTLARDPWAGALHLGSLAAWPAWAWGWAPMLCWAASILYSFNIVRQLGVRVATLQNRVSAVEGREAQLVGMVQTLEGTVTILEDRVMYLEDRLKVAGETRLVLPCTFCMLSCEHLLHQQEIAALAHLPL